MGVMELRRRVMSNQLRLATAEGDGIVSFRSSAALPVKSAIVNFEPVQGCEGDPSPENVRPITGWNSVRIYDPYQDEDVDITLPETIYGGYIDLTKGELVATYGYRKIVGNENWIMSGAISDYCAYRPTIAEFYQPTSAYILPTCDKLKGVAKWATSIYEATISNGGNFYFGVPEELSTKEAVNTWVQSIGGIDVVYPLVDPIHYPLSPTVIRTLKGMNNIQSNANGKITIQYWTH